MGKPRSITIDNYDEQDEETKIKINEKIRKSDKELFKFHKLNTVAKQTEWLKKERGIGSIRTEKKIEDVDKIQTEKKIEDESDDMTDENKAELQLAMERSKKMDNLNDVVNKLSFQMDEINNNLHLVKDDVKFTKDKNDANAKLTISQFTEMNKKVNSMCDDGKCTLAEIAKLHTKMEKTDEQTESVLNLIGELKTIGTDTGDTFIKIDEKINEICKGSECTVGEINKINEKLEEDTKSGNAIIDSIKIMSDKLCEDGKCTLDKFNTTDLKLNQLINTADEMKEELYKKECPKCGKKTLIDGISTSCSNPDCDARDIVWEDDEEIENDDLIGNIEYENT